MEYRLYGVINRGRGVHVPSRAWSDEPCGSDDTGARHGILVQSTGLLISPKARTIIPLAQADSVLRTCLRFTSPQCAVVMCWRFRCYMKKCATLTSSAPQNWEMWHRLNSAFLFRLMVLRFSTLVTSCWWFHVDGFTYVCFAYVRFTYVCFAYVRFTLLVVEG